MTLLEEIESKCTPQEIAAGDFHAIAAIVSAGRTRSNAAEIGNGTILETIGKTKGNVVLDLVYADPSNKYVIPLLEQGRLKAGSADFQSALGQLLLGGVLTAPEHAALSAIGLTADPVGWEACRTAIQGA